MFWTVIAGLSLAAWIYLFLARGFYWRADQRLGAPPAPVAWPEVVAVIPARNEAETIGAVVASHVATRYPGKFSLVVADDASNDGTGALADAAARGSARAFEIVKTSPLEEGWTGKLWAVNAGVERAKELASNARYLLLTDADIIHAPETLQRLVAKAEADALDLTSLMAKLDCRGIWGGLLVPAFIYFFQKLYPFPSANNPRSKIAAAAGGCMLVRKTALEAIGGVEAIRDKLIDDCALATAIKSNNGRLWIGLADQAVISLRDNRSLSSIWTMVARTAYAQLQHSTLQLLGAIISMALIYLAPPLVVVAFLFHENLLALTLSVAAMTLMLLTYRPTLRLYGRPSIEGLGLPVAAIFYLLMTVDSALKHQRGAGGLWKGRTYP